MHVRHSDDRNAADLEAALRAAEDAVKNKLGYTIALTEKPLFDYSESENEGPPSPHHENDAVRQGYDEAAAAATAAAAAAAAASAAAGGASSSTQGPAAVCGNKRSLSDIDDNDPELNAAIAEAERRS